MKPSLRCQLFVALALLIAIGAVLLWPARERAGSIQVTDITPAIITPPATSPPAAATTGEETRNRSADSPLPGARTGEHIVEAVDDAVGKGTAHDFRSRLDAIGRLGIDLTPEALSIVYGYLRSPDEEADLQPGQSFALKNDLLNLLREQRSTPTGLTQLLLDIRRDEAQPLVMRDYALQHLAPWFTRAGAEERRQILEELRAAAAEIQQSYAGTALLALNRVRQEQPGAEVPPLNNPILKLLGDSSANLLARITAVQLSGSLGLSESGPLVASLAFDESVAPSLRTAAIRAVGALGMPNVEGRLRETSNSHDPRYRLAALAAMKQSDRATRRNSQPE